MPQISPTAEGFRTVFRRPLIAFAEVTWRWVIGATATALFFFGLFEFLNTLPVSSGDLLFLKSRQPFLISQAIAHILRGTLYRGVISLMFATLLVAALWMLAASFGKIATLRAIFDCVRARIEEKTAAAEIENVPEDLATQNPLRALLRLNFLRLAILFASLVGFWGASILASFASTQAHPQPGVVFLIFLPIALMIALAWFWLNWLLSLAAVFAVRNGEDAIGAIDAAVTLCRERPGAVVAVSFWTALAHLAAFVAATTAVSLPFSLVALLPWRLVLLAVILLILIYFAVVDWIYTARMAGYAAILEMPQAWWRPPRPFSSPSAPLPSSTIDKDELILSDLPNLATQP